MSDLVVIVYPNEEKAEEVRKRLFELQSEYLIKIGDAVIATRDDKGRVKLNQVMNMTAAGAAAGSFWGLLIGVLFLNPLVGVAAGAGAGALGGAGAGAWCDGSGGRRLGGGPRWEHRDPAGSASG